VLGLMGMQPHPFMSATELLAICAVHGALYCKLIRVNEDSFRDRDGA
jgi:hypothetical protein